MLHLFLGSLLLLAVHDEEAKSVANALRNRLTSPGDLAWGVDKNVRKALPEPNPVVDTLRRNRGGHRSHLPHLRHEQHEMKPLNSLETKYST